MCHAHCGHGKEMAAHMTISHSLCQPSFLQQLKDEAMLSASSGYGSNLCPVPDCGRLIKGYVNNLLQHRLNHLPLSERPYPCDRSFRRTLV